MADAAPAPAPPPPLADFPAPAEPAAEPSADQAAAREPSAESNLVVTGSRIRRQGLLGPGASEQAREDRPAAAKSAGRGDWNACTIDDPRRDLGGCGRAIDPRTKSGADLADGLSLAWQGDPPGAVAAFARAIHKTPRSAVAYLNRGIAYRRMGKLDL